MSLGSREGAEGLAEVEARDFGGAVCGGGRRNVCAGALSGWTGRCRADMGAYGDAKTPGDEARRGMVGEG